MAEVLYYLEGVGGAASAPDEKAEVLLYLEGVGGAASAPDEMAEVRGQDVLEDPLLVLLGGLAGAVAADHAGR